MEAIMATDVHRPTRGARGRGRIGIAAVVLLAVAAPATWASLRNDGASVPTDRAADAPHATQPGSFVQPGSTLQAAPFAAADLEGLVLRPAEGDGLVPGLEYSPAYSGRAYVENIRHYTLIPPERLEAAGYVNGQVAIFMTPEFLSSFASGGRDLLTVAMLFETTAGAREAFHVVADTRDELWETWRPLPFAGGIGTTGRLGSDNVTVTYPTVGFSTRVGNVVLLVGSQGGSERNRPLPVRIVWGVAEELRLRALDTIGGGS
jgi:hypothetical protein